VSDRYRLGIDVGGTFTDAILWDATDGAARIAKLSSTPDDPSIGFLGVARRVLDAAGVGHADVPLIVHGTTIATNAIIQGRLARTAFVTTAGFRDMLELARQIRPSLYDLQFQKPRPLVPRDRCFGIPERLDARGNVLAPLDEGTVRAVAEELRRQEVQAVAVCFLHAYVNPAHEQRAAAILREALSGVAVSASSEVAPEIREYFRASTTVVNAGISPLAQKYLGGIERSLAEDAFDATLLVMQSNGGVMTAASARQRSVFLVESGPAAGVIASAHLATTLDRRDVISFDMGGTTAKAGLIRDGLPTITKEYEVGARAEAGIGAARGSGYPIRTPVIDLVEIGAGGSIAWVDSGGGLRVGPQSAGADPGPACYGLGSDRPTVTDANLVLGRINADYFLGGSLKIDPDAARRAIEAHCARPLGMGVVEAAHGIVEIANAAMTNAIRLISVQRGHDPRDFALVAFGGAGPLHANRLAAELRVPTTIVPPSPGIFSALGLLATDLTHELSRTVRQSSGSLDGAAVDAALAALEAEGRRALASESVPPSRVSCRRYLEMRYAGQSYELSIPLGDGSLAGGRLADALAAFHREHERIYGFAAPAEPVEVVNVRATVVGAMLRPRPRRVEPDRGVDAALKQTREVYFGEAGGGAGAGPTGPAGFVACPIYDRYRLGSGATLDGPAVVEELDSTTVIHPGYRATVDELGNLLLTARA
jgi:N-methylhydantoinase A